MPTITLHSGEPLIRQNTYSLNDGKTTLISGVKDAVAITTVVNKNTIHNPFPEGVEVSQLPDVVKESWRQVQTHNLPPEKQSKISYHKRKGDWVIKIDHGDAKVISMQNATATSDPDNGVHVVRGNTYFGEVPAHRHAIIGGGKIPCRKLWEETIDFLGGFRQLKDILQLPFGTAQSPDHGADLWCEEMHLILHIDDHGGYFIRSSEGGYPGLSVRIAYKDV